MSGWMLRIEDRDHAVQNIEELRTWVREGRVQPSHYIYNPTLEKWLYARDAEELKPAFAAATKRPAPTMLNRPAPAWAIPAGLLTLIAWYYWERPNPFGFEQFTFAPTLAVVAIIIAVIGARRNSRRAQGL